MSESLKTARSPPPTNDVPGAPSLPGSGATAYLSWLDAGVLDQPGVPRAGDEGAVRAVGEAALELARVEQPGRREALVEERLVVLERLGHLRASRSCTPCRPRWSASAPLDQANGMHGLPRAGLAGLQADAVLGAALVLQVLANCLARPRSAAPRPSRPSRPGPCGSRGRGSRRTRHAVRRAADLGGAPGAREEVGLVDQALRGRRQAAGLGELTHPGGADQADVGVSPAGDRVGDLVVRRLPRDRR